VDLTTAARVKALASGYGSSSSEDTRLAAAITGVSAAVERHMDRWIEWVTWTDYFPVEPGQTTFRLHAFPQRGADASFTVIPRSTFHVYNDVSDETTTYTQFPSTTEITSGWHIDNERGLLLFDNYRPMPGPRALKVQYVGGFNSTLTGGSKVTNFVTLYPDIATAVEVQVQFELDRARQPGVSSRTTQAGSIEILSDVQMIPLVAQRLSPYRRVAVG
jgi:hypothetical protein